jgi:hypothetical protein
MFMDPEAEEALRELEQGELWAPHRAPRQEKQTACDALQLPSFATLCSTLQEILQGVDVTSATFGQVRIELARRLKVTEEALEPCRQQLGDIVKGFLEQPNAIPKSADRPVKSWRNHYGGVWSHSEDPEFRAPQSMPKAQFGQLLLETSESVLKTAVAGGKKSRLNRFDKASVWEELHQNGKPHYHFICLADDPWSFVPLARALRAKGINVDFSHEHDYYWTSVIYVAVPSSLPGGKKVADIDADPWLSPGHPSVKETLQDIPRGARACDKTRVRRYLGAQSTTGKPGKNLAFSDKEPDKRYPQANSGSGIFFLRWSGMGDLPSWATALRPEFPLGLL